MPPFHVAFPVHDLKAARVFYTQVLGCAVGRSAPDWIDFDLQGHQLSAHLRPEACEPAPTHDVDGDAVPVRHFGLVLRWDDWEGLAQRLRAQGIPFVIRPHVRFQGKVGEQATLFIRDPSGNVLEFKSLRDPKGLFQTAPVASSSASDPTPSAPVKHHSGRSPGSGR